MARMMAAAFLLAAAMVPAWPQAATDVQLKQAGVCARCHVISVVEWGISGHQKAGTDCVACHGPSLGHVRDERNNIKPDRLPHAAAIAGLCATCHAAGCPKSKRTDACQTCHHVHALLDPNKPPASQDERLEQLIRKSQVAARRRPEIGGLRTTFLPSVPQVFIQVDRDKVLKQGVAVGDVYRTLQCYLGGVFVNYFNRFGRQWQVYVEAEDGYRNRVEDLGLYHVRNRDGRMVPLTALTDVETRLEPDFVMRYNLFRSTQINATAAKGYSPAQARRALEEVFARTMPREMGYDYIGMSFQEKKAQEGVPAIAICSLSGSNSGARPARGMASVWCRPAASSSCSSGRRALPAALTTRPQLGSRPWTAALKRLLLTTLRAMARRRSRRPRHSPGR